MLSDSSHDLGYNCLKWRVEYSVQFDKYLLNDTCCKELSIEFDQCGQLV